MKMISVCMALYNGEKYVEEQLESIRLQSVGPDEVVLCDDGSGDATVPIVKRFLEKYGLAGKWRLYCNAEHKGYPANFYYAMGLCRGEIVFLADQDDVWESRKLESMERRMRGHEEIKALYCGFRIMDASGKRIRSLMPGGSGRTSGGMKKVTVPDVFYKSDWPGMTIAYRNDWYQGKFAAWQAENGGKACPAQIPHDFLLCAWAAECGGLWHTDEVFVWQRRHGNNTGGEEHRVSRLLNRDRKLWEIDKYNRILEGFEKDRIFHTLEAAAVLEEKHAFMREREMALRQGSLGRIVRNVWRHRRGVRPATCLCDLLIACRKRR